MEPDCHHLIGIGTAGKAHYLFYLILQGNKVVAQLLIIVKITPPVEGKERLFNCVFSERNLIRNSFMHLHTYWLSARCIYFNVVSIQKFQNVNQ